METSPRPTRGGETVLVVEDNRDLAEIINRFLARDHYRVLIAGGGDEALEIAGHAAERIDLLLTDVMLPSIQGRELAEQIGVLCPGVRVLYMSGYAKQVLVPLGALDSGAVLVEKPFSAHILLARVREVLNA